MKRHVRIVLGFAALACLLIGACSAPAQRSQSVAADEDLSKEAGAKKDPGGSGSEGRVARRREEVRRKKGAGSVAAGSQNGSAEEGGEGKVDSQPWASTVEDLERDVDGRGDPPGYVDLVLGRVERGPSMFTFTISVADRFPAAMPDTGTSAFVSIGFRKGDDDYFLQAEASTSGWSAGLARNGRSMTYRGRFRVEDDEMTFVVPWSELGGVGRLRWMVETSWTRATTLNTYYAFDRAPRAGTRPFPDR